MYNSYMRKKHIVWWIPPVLLSISTLLLLSVLRNSPLNNPKIKNEVNNVNEDLISPLPVKPTPSPTTVPTPKPLTFTQMNALYGPCTNTPVLMYHHIQSETQAKEKKQITLTTYTDTFEEQLKYLQSNGYQTIDIGKLVGFFKGENTIQLKSILLTFDDGYTDFYEVAFPLIKKYNYKAVVFLPTGLVNNYGYLTWPEITEMKDSGFVYFGNHTWSHYGTPKDEQKTKTEIETADTQLSEKGLNANKVFAYPYGSSNPYSVNTLKSLNYNLAFTTTHGITLCAKKNLELPRLRAGNLMPSYYGM